VSSLTKYQKDKLLKSDTFCTLPWIHMHGWATGKAYPCCVAESKYPVGSLKENTLEELFNSEDMKEMRRNMLADRPCKQCTRCYEHEESGFISYRESMNREFASHVDLVNKTEDDGTMPEFKMRYLDIRFSNLCNFKCRSCGDMFSSTWAKELKEHGDWGTSPTVIYAGKYKSDMWEQMIPHIDTFEQIYFAGGEPLLMQEHYELLNNLIKLGKTDIPLVYNSNFSTLIYKQTDVLDLWKQFDSVAIGASLDASYERGELMRSGTVWKDIVKNRERQLKECPHIDFYVSSTLSIMNSFNIVDFHREWVDLGLIEPKDWNINILLSDDYYRLDVLPTKLKEQVKEKYEDHIRWLQVRDPLTRATNGFKSAIRFMEATDNSHLIPRFNKVNYVLDKRRAETFYDVFPELGEMRDDNNSANT
tara:strand:+ start:3781 stop:5037 length:1257 start_codon:yes stop_codon:yes gene_type:complete